MDPKIAKKTQDTLGKIIKKPPLTEKLLGKPPFRFLHDVITSVIKSTGFMNGLYSESELNSENVKDKEAKIGFLQKAIDMVCLVIGKQLSVRPNKIVAGHEPEKTNEFLQALADAVTKKVNNEDYVKKTLRKGKGGDSKDDDDRRREEKKSREKSKERSKEERREERKEREREERKDRDRDDRKDRDDRDDRKDRDEEKRERREKSGRDREKRSRRHRDEDKENDEEMVNGDIKGEETQQHSRLQRPTSAKGSRRRREANEDDNDKKPVVERNVDSTIMGDENLPPQVAAARKLARPSSARPAPPRPKQDGIEAEPAMRMGSGKPTNLIVDGDASDEDDTFMVEESAPPPEPPETESKPDLDEDAEHGGLVKKILETKKELESGSQPITQKKVEIERPTVSDTQRRKQREQVEKEVNKLRTSIQTLTRNTQPLGRIMDFIQEDLDSMQKEVEKWKAENKEHALNLKRERNVTDHALDPLKAQLAELDQSIKDQLGLIGAVKSNILRNDQKIEKMLKSIGKS